LHWCSEEVTGFLLYVKVSGRISIVAAYWSRTLASLLLFNVHCWKGGIHGTLGSPPRSATGLWPQCLAVHTAIFYQNHCHKIHIQIPNLPHNLPFWQLLTERILNDNRLVVLIGRNETWYYHLFYLRLQNIFAYNVFLHPEESTPAELPTSYIFLVPFFVAILGVAL